MNHDAMASPKPPAMPDKMGMGGNEQVDHLLYQHPRHPLLHGMTTITVASSIATIICLFLLTVLNRFLGAVKFQIERAWLEQARKRTMFPLLPTGRNGRLFFKAKLSPVPTSMARDDDLECDPLTSPTDGDW